MSRHDHLVDLIVKDLKTIHKDSQIYQHTTVELNWLYHNTYDRDYFKNIPNTPDIVIVNKALNTVFVIEVGGSFDLYLDTCYLSKLLKYQPLLEAIHQLDYQCKLITLVFGSLGHVHKNVIKGLQLGGLQIKPCVPVILQTYFPKYLDSVFVACLVDPNKRRKCVCFCVCVLTHNMI